MLRAGSGISIFILIIMGLDPLHRGHSWIRDSMPVQPSTNRRTFIARHGPMSYNTMADKPTHDSAMQDKKAQPVYTADDIFRFVDLGLGRGLDATNPTPWLNKTSFQVRRVHKDNILGTEEGGALQSYEREVSSVHSQQASMKFSITVPQSPIDIGADSEQSRTLSTTRRAIGKRVLNRTISFKDDFVDVPLSVAKDLPSAREAALSTLNVMTQPSGENVIIDAQLSLLTFEERLASWLVQRISAHREKNEALEKIGDEASASDRRVASEAATIIAEQENSSALEALARIIHRGEKEELKLLLNACRDFVTHFRITHYVSAIELGAAEYRVLTEQDYYSKVGLGGSFGLEKLVGAVFSGSASSRRTKKASDLRTIGNIAKPQGTVERGSYAEAVVGVKIQPISNLVRLQFLQLALKKALVHFVEKQGDASGK